jgi:tryptophan-rich sensory protein
LLGVTALAAYAGALASVRAQAFYRELALPGWAPPPWLFGPVWTVLYAMMAVAAWLVVRARGWPGARAGMGLYLVQLAVNALWTWLFFAWRMGAAAFGEILLLFGLIAAMLLLFWRARPLAGALLVPYLLWVGFAACLTWSIWRGNRALL